MSKKSLLFGLILAFVLILAIGPVLAKNQNDDSDEPNLPEEEGSYDVPDRPDLKVRVFVYRAKPAKPNPPAMACNLPDPDSTALVGSAGWHLPSGDWTYILNPNNVPASVGSANLATMANDAFGRWSDATGSTSTVTFSRSSVDTTKTRAGLDSQNIIAWGRINGSALGITYIWYNQTTGLVAEVDTIMNLKFPWGWSDPAGWINPESTCADQNAYDAQSILTHELGHWLGLNDFYTADYQNATMYGYGAKGEIKGTTLSAGDIDGIGVIYP